ncbi:hypothetical protein ACFX2F_030384 [Malus domestica]
MRDLTVIFPHLRFFMVHQLRYRSRLFGSNKEPELLLALPNAVLDMIETHEGVMAEVEPLSSLFTWLVGSFKALEPHHEKDFEAELKAHGFSPPSCTADKGLLLSFITFGYCRRCCCSSKELKKTDADVENTNKWVLARSWNRRPIGMLPRAVGFSGWMSIMSQKRFLDY